MDSDGRPLRSGRKRLYHQMGHYQNPINTRQATLLSDGPRWRGKIPFEPDPLDEAPPTPTPSYSMRKRHHDTDLVDFSSSMMTRRSKRFEEDDYLDKLPPTPQKSWSREKRGDEDYVDEHFDSPSSSTSPLKRARWEDVHIASRYAPSVASSMYANVSSTSSICSENPPLNNTSYSTEYILSLDMEHSWGEVDRSVALSSTNDPMLRDANKKTGNSNDLDTPNHSPPMTPVSHMDDMSMSMVPATPGTPRPDTPGISSPLSPSIDTGIGAGSLVDDDGVIDHDDAGSLVAATTLSQLGPLPTQLCHSRVGNVLSSSTSTCSSLLMQKFSSAILSRTSSVTSPPSTTFSAPPINILESDEDDNDPEVIVIYEQKSSHNRSNFPSTITSSVQNRLSPPHPPSSPISAPPPPSLPPRPPSPPPLNSISDIRVNSVIVINPNVIQPSEEVALPPSTTDDDDDGLASILNTSKPSPDIITGYDPSVELDKRQSTDIVETRDNDDDGDLGSIFLDTAGSTFSNRHSHRLKIRPQISPSYSSKSDRQKHFSKSRSRHFSKNNGKLGDAGCNKIIDRSRSQHERPLKHSSSPLTRNPVQHTITSILKRPGSTTKLSSSSPTRRRPATACAVRFKFNFLKSPEVKGDVGGRDASTTSRDRHMHPHDKQGSSGSKLVFLTPATPKPKISSTGAHVVNLKLDCCPTPQNSWVSSEPVVRVTSDDKNDEQNGAATKKNGQEDGEGLPLPLNVVGVQPHPIALFPPQYSKHEGYIQDGNISYLKMTNFMAYSLGEWDFKPGVTFLQGKNGSGKSAIQIGMKMLFGEKAANTLRTSSAHKFIKRGTLFAEIEGHLTNYNGTLLKAKYGDVIALRRRIKESCSTYKIREIDGRWRIIKQVELGVIIHSLNIDPDNPFQFLQQDRFKESSKPGSSHQSRKDFIKFCDATKLTAIKDMLICSQANIAVADEVVKEKEEERELFSWKEKRLKEDLDQINRLEMNQNRVAELEVELAWSEVKVYEDMLKQVQVDRSEVCHKQVEVEKKKKQKDQEITNFNALEKKNKALLQEKQIEIEKLQMFRRAKESDFNELKRTQRRAQQQYDEVATAIVQYNRKIKQLEAQMSTEKTVIDYEAENQKHRDEIQECEIRIAKINEDLAKIRVARDIVSAEINKIKDDERAEREKIHELEKQLSDIKQELTKKDNYGRHIKILVEKIERYKRWHAEPIGPLGRYLTVPDGKYAPLIEHILYGELFGFFVFTNDDLMTLKKLIGEVFSDAEKAKMRGRLRDPKVTLVPQLSAAEVNKLSRTKDKFKRFRSVVSMLKFKDPSVEHALVQLTNCERVVLFDTNKQAGDTLMDERNFPMELKLGYTLQWFKVVPSPNYKFQVIHSIKNKTDILPMAKEESSNNIKAEIERRRETIKTCKIHLLGENGLSYQLKQHDRKMAEEYKHINQLNCRIKNAQNMIKAEPDVSLEDRDVADQIEVEKKLLADAQKEIVKPRKDLDNYKTEHADVRQEVDKISTKLNELKAQMDEMEDQHNGHKEKVTKLQRESDALDVEVKKLKKQFEDQGKTENTMFFKLNELTELAKKKGQRPENERLSDAPATLRDQLKQLKKCLDVNQDKLAQKPRVHDEYKSCQSHVLLITNEINLIQRLRSKVESLIYITDDFYKHLQGQLSNLLKKNYQTLVEANGVTGDLDIDWDKKTLFYFVCPDKNAELQAKQRAKTEYVLMLSGGERSKSLVFFIMAMWNLTDLPFVVLDEFENCLDAEARQGVHKEIIYYANKSREAQFLVLTPLAVENIPEKLRSFVRTEHVEFCKKRKIENVKDMKGSPDAKKRKIFGKV